MCKYGDGLIGALYQYWVTDMSDKARLYKRNTYFEEHFNVDNHTALKIGVAVSILATAIIMSWSIIGWFL